MMLKIRYNSDKEMHTGGNHRYGSYVEAQMIEETKLVC